MPESSERNALTEAVFYILLALQKPLHGYGIMQYVDEISKGRVKLGSGTLYGAINTLLKKEWIQIHSEDGKSRKKKEYIITPSGLEVAFGELKRLEDLAKLGNDLLITGGKEHV